MMQPVLQAYGLEEKAAKIEVFGSGLINSTWKITTADREYILQRVNDIVFENPDNIASNVRQIATYLEQHSPNYNFIAPVVSLDGNEMIHLEGGCFRMFPFVAGSHSKDVVQTPGEAYEAALQFGKFTKLLTGFDAVKLKTTITSFHDLVLRYQQFLISLENGNKERINECRSLINSLITYEDIVETYRRIISDPGFKVRVTHHDTKISNVLFDARNKGICVIDFDTVMPGYFTSDVGDMMRTYLSPVNEEENDFEKIQVREEFYKALVDGYYSEMKDELTETEKHHFFYAGKFMIYIQALRFLTDYLNSDVYYGATYPEQNLVRATNQFVLLQRLLEKEDILQKIL